MWSLRRHALWSTSAAAALITSANHGRKSKASCQDTWRNQIEGVIGGVIRSTRAACQDTTPKLRRTLSQRQVEQADTGAEFDPFGGTQKGWVFDPFGSWSFGGETERPWYHWMPFWHSHLQTHGIPFSSAAVLVTLLVTRLQTHDRYYFRKIPRIAPGIAGLALVSCIIEKAWQYFKPQDSLPRRDVDVEQDGFNIDVGGSNFDLQWACASMQGWRPTMEDGHIAQVVTAAGSVLGIFGVFDGHGGWEASAVVRDLFLPMFTIGFSKSKDSGNSIPEVLSETVEALDIDLKGGPMGCGHLLKDEGHQFLHPFAWVGTTACIAVLDPQAGQLVVSNTGDSRAVLCRGGRAVALTKDHSIEVEEEAKRILEAGGRIERDGPCLRVDGFLNMSRSLGDFHYKADSSLALHQQKIIARPTVTTFSWSPTSSDEFLVVGCDGIFERLSVDDVVAHIQQGLAMGAPGEFILKGLLQSGCANYPWEEGQDNQTAILIQWRGNSP